MCKKDGSTERKMTYLEWMLKIQSVHYACGEKMDRGIAVDMQHNLYNSK